MSAIALKILVNGEDLQASFGSRKGTVNRVEVLKALNQHSHCVIELSQFAGSRPEIERWIGQPISLQSTATGVKVFAGFVLDVKLIYQTAGSYQCIIQSVSQSYKSDLAPRYKYYGPVSISAAAQQMARDSGIPISAKSGGGATSALDLVQWAETDWHFLWRLCDDFGVYLVATDDGIIIDDGFSESGPELQWRSDQDSGLVEFFVGGSIGAPFMDGCHYDFSVSQSQTFQQISQDPSLSGAASNFANAVKQQSKSILKSGYKSWRNRAKSISDYQTSLQHEAEWSIGSRLQCGGVSRCEELAPGQSVQVSGVLDGEGKYNIVRVAHQWSPEGYTNQFACSPWTKYRSHPHPARPSISGVHSARVVNIDDPQRQGQVQVQYYWQEQGQTTWIRHLTPYAGADRGLFFRPEVGDEVLVAFEEGDPERPVILGSAWNMSDSIPNEDFWGGETHNNDVKRIVTKSGHRISLIDKQGEESIGIATPVHTKLVMYEKTEETGRPAIVMNVDNGDLIFNAPNGRIHFHAKYWSREVGE
ncbi:MAG TPA: phage baseplate assembly protein V [Alloacidobacterium sp.]|nr:phage baseplate assembly protein V [Alloacidobacterium sp.]